MININNLVKNGLNGPTLSKFLTIKEQQLLNHKNLEIRFSSIYPDEERKRAFIYPKNDNADPFFSISIISFENTDFSHADCLGAVMSLGVTREVIGDIIIDDYMVYIIIASEIKKYILENLKKVKNQYIKVKEISIESLKDIKNVNLIEDNIIISSLRLDVVVATICKFSRSKSQEYIKKGLIKVNGIVLDKYDYFLKSDDYISIRKYGRTYIRNIIRKTKKDKLVVLVDRTN
ncbi:MAG: YlmH/Sll1252 family protein [Bacilli bacterium]|jgi:RNA-binding protein YlmH|nr:YlmH/Sll1252 family protein [Bacilli bacterium]